MKTIRLDLQKGEGLTKAFTSRVADEGDTLRVNLTDSGSQLNMNNVSKVYLKATKPDGKYVYVGGTLTDTGADFIIPSGFNSVKGYFKTAYVEIETKDAKLRSTQPFMYYSYGDADINDSNAGDYISRVEELIKELNDKVDAMIDNVEPQVNQIKADLAQARADLDAFIIQIDGEPWAHRVTMITGSVDWNTILNMGTYQVNAATGANVPVTVSGGIAGILTVYKRGDANKVQEFILVSADVKTNGMIYRRSSTGAGSLVWSAWTRDVTLYETENGMMIQRRTAVTTHDWNTLTSVGIYNVSNASGANKPSSIENYGVLEVFNRGTVAAQRYTTTEGSIFYRMQGGSPTAWYDWQQLANATWTNNNFVHKTGNENIAGVKTFTDNSTFNGLVTAKNGLTVSGGVTVNNVAEFKTMPKLTGKDLVQPVWYFGWGESTAQTNVPFRARFGQIAYTQGSATVANFPMTFNDSRFEATLNRDVTLEISFNLMIQGNGTNATTDYVYVYYNQGESTGGSNGMECGKWGATAGQYLNLMNTIHCYGVIKFKAGEKFALTGQGRSGKYVLNAQIMNGYFREVL